MEVHMKGCSAEIYVMDKELSLGKMAQYVQWLKIKI